MNFFFAIYFGRSVATLMLGLMGRELNKQMNVRTSLCFRQETQFFFALFAFFNFVLKGPNFF